MTPLEREHLRTATAECAVGDAIDVIVRDMRAPSEGGQLKRRVELDVDDILAVAQLRHRRRMARRGM